MINVLKASGMWEVWLESSLGAHDGVWLSNEKTEAKALRTARRTLHREMMMLERLIKMQESELANRHERP